MKLLTADTSVNSKHATAYVGCHCLWCYAYTEGLTSESCTVVQLTR